MEDVRAALQAGTANRPKGDVTVNGQRLQIYTGTGMANNGKTASDYRDMVVAWRGESAVRLADIAEVSDGVENINTMGLFNGRPAVIVLVTLQAGANVIATVDGVRALLPALQAALPKDITLEVASDRTHSIRSSLHEVELTLGISILLVVLVVSLFLHSARATLIPAVATIVSLLGTFGVMKPAGLLAEQPVADGADGGRPASWSTTRSSCWRTPRATSRPAWTASRRRCKGAREVGLHGAVDQRVADRGLHPAAVHGRPGRPPVPRVRRHAVGGRDDLAGSSR
jgi:hypothetical protein